MAKRKIQRDPMAAQARKAVAQRRVGVDATCGCGEHRPAALIRKGKDVSCGACARKREGKTTLDNHHVAGKSNSPITIPIPVNDHKAWLTEDQFDWPRKTLENIDRSPLLAGAGCIRGFCDTVTYLVERLLLWIAEMLEELNELLVERSGEKWWLNTPLRIFTPGGCDAKN